MEGFLTTLRYHYAEEYVSVVGDQSAREYLVNRGIPETEGFFAGGVSGDQEKVTTSLGLSLLYIGRADDPRGFFAIGCENGEVYYVMPHATFLANSSPRQFAESLEMYVSVTSDRSIVDDPEAVEGALRSALIGIDPPAIEDSGSLWNDVLSDVMIGIYGDDEDDD
ncbi:SUKH-4 family immunity protein [Streptomyces sp. NPDC050549]|uniref:SUKH-4 family immunity protein n=1 Tax=Streptomyces sp. NPDC050549 TaxID=3155406 RepID=UPI003444BD52